MMKDKNATVFKSPPVRKAIACCIALLLLAALAAVGCEIRKQIAYEREIRNELRHITKKPGGI